MHILPISALNAIAWTLTTFAILLTAGRFYLHYRTKHRLGWDDYFNGLAALFLLGFTTTYQLVIGIEFNTRAYDMNLSNYRPPDSELIRGMRIQIANLLLFLLVVYSVKASFLALYWHIFNVSRGFRVAWWGVLVYTVVGFLVSWLATFWSCGSPDKTADINACSGDIKTSPAINILIMWCVINVFGDVLLMILPIAMLRSLPLMRMSQKLGLALVFSLVLVSIIFNIMRTLYSVAISPKYRDQNLIWTILEPNTVVIVCALPCYRGLLSWGTVSTVTSSFSGFSGSFWRERRSGESRVGEDGRAEDGRTGDGREMDDRGKANMELAGNASDEEAVVVGIAR